MAEVEVPIGSTAGDAVKAVGRDCSLAPPNFQLRDLIALVVDPRGGLSAAEWLADSKRALEQDEFRLWLEVRVQGG